LHNGPTSRAENRIAQYLYEGESIRSAFGVVLSSHRVLASLPDGGIERAELPNVTGVSRETQGSLSGVVQGVSLTILGVGLSVRAGEAFDTPESREDAVVSAGGGGLTGLVDLVLWAVENLDLLCSDSAQSVCCSRRFRLRTTGSGPASGVDLPGEPGTEQPWSPDSFPDTPGGPGSYL